MSLHEIRQTFPAQPFERSEDDSSLMSRSNLLVIGSLSAASWVAVYALVELGRTAMQIAGA